jgi:endonuclease/exonuclease/phosphatase family metal-dependent hydrolase
LFRRRLHHHKLSHVAILAALLALGPFAALAACGSSASSPPDAGSPDAQLVSADGAPEAEPSIDAGSETERDAARDAPIESGPVVCGTERVRVVAGNLSGASSTYDDERGIRIFRGLHPDVALVQEVRYGDNSATAQRAFVDAAFGTSYAFVRGGLGGGADIPNAVVSRFPILDSGEWVDPYVSNRSFVWARIDVPGAADLYAVSVHLLTTNFGDRAGEAQSLVGRLQALPAGSLVILGGDFNTSTRTESAITTFGQVFATGGPYPVDQAGNPNTNTTRARPYDWVLATAALDTCKVPVTVGATPFPSGLVFDSRVFVPLTDVAPVQLSDSDSPLQHMAVVREFVLPL